MCAFQSSSGPPNIRRAGPCAVVVQERLLLVSLRLCISLRLVQWVMRPMLALFHIAAPACHRRWLARWRGLQARRTPQLLDSCWLPPPSWTLRCAPLFFRAMKPGGISCLLHTTNGWHPGQPIVVAFRACSEGCGCAGSFGAGVCTGSRRLPYTFLRASIRICPGAS